MQTLQYSNEGQNSGYNGCCSYGRGVEDAVMPLNMLVSQTCKTHGTHKQRRWGVLSVKFDIVVRKVTKKVIQI
jgi:hypothetical protein